MSCHLIKPSTALYIFSFYNSGIIDQKESKHVIKKSGLCRKKYNATAMIVQQYCCYIRLIHYTTLEIFVSYNRYLEKEKTIACEDSSTAEKITK